MKTSDYFVVLSRRAGEQIRSYMPVIGDDLKSAMRIALPFLRTAQEVDRVKTRQGETVTYRWWDWRRQQSGIAKVDFPLDANGRPVPQTRRPDAAKEPLLLAFLSDFSPDVTDQPF